MSKFETTFEMCLDFDGADLPDVDVEVTADVVGKYIPASYWQPAEGPEVDILSVTLPGVDQDYLDDYNADSDRLGLPRLTVKPGEDVWGRLTKAQQEEVLQRTYQALEPDPYADCPY